MVQKVMEDSSKDQKKRTRNLNPRTNMHAKHLGRYSSMEELKQDVYDKLNCITFDNQIVPSIEFIEVESAEPCLGKSKT